MARETVETRSAIILSAQLFYVRFICSLPRGHRWRHHRSFEYMDVYGRDIRGVWGLWKCDIWQSFKLARSGDVFEMEDLTWSIFSISIFSIGRKRRVKIIEGGQNIL